MSAEIWTVDIETRPTEAWVWGTWNENIPVDRIIEPGGVMMFAAKQYGRKTIEAHCEWDDREAMLRRAHEIYSAADYVVTYNGVGFDNKWLKGEWAQLGLAPPAPWRDLDLLKTVRQFRLPSRKLAYACKVFGVDAKGDPGGMETWRQIMRPDSEELQKAAQRRMVRYCRQDVRITEELFDRLRPWIGGLNVPLYRDDETDDARLCTRCGHDTVWNRGWAYTTTYRYRRFQCAQCGGWMRARKSEPLVNAELRNA